MNRRDVMLRFIYPAEGLVEVVGGGEAEVFESEVGDVV